MHEFNWLNHGQTWLIIKLKNKVTFSEDIRRISEGNIPLKMTKYVRWNCDFHDNYPTFKKKDYTAWLEFVTWGEQGRDPLNRSRLFSSFNLATSAFISWHCFVLVERSISRQVT